MRSAFNEPRPESYFDELPQAVQDSVRELLLETIEQVEGWKSGDEMIDELECRARDGFIPRSFNRGGFVAHQFTDLSALESSGKSVAHERAAAEIQRQIDYGYQCARETFFEHHKQELEALGITSNDDERLNYHDLYELKQGRLAEELSEYERENLSDDSSSIMFEARFMYHGKLDGVHSASVSCAVNTEGPYHRSHISWAPNVFCEGAKEVEIEWRTPSELKRKLKSALKRTSGEVF